MVKSGIYIIINNINNYCYIGSAVNIKRRWSLHRFDLFNGKHHSNKLQHAYNKYKEENFKYEVLLYCDKRDLIFFEQRAINAYKPEYNICLTAGSTLGSPRPTLATLNKSRTGIKLSEQHKQNIAIAQIGSKRTQETKQKMAESAKKLPPKSDSHRKNLSRSHIGKAVGALSGMAKITWEQVRSMRTLYATKQYSMRALARHFNIGYTTAQYIIKNITWKE